MPCCSHGYRFLPGRRLGYLVALAVLLTAGRGAEAAGLAAGTHVVALLNVAVHASASTTASIVGTQPAGALGTIVQGPVSQGGSSFYQVDFKGTLDGWATASRVGPAYFPPAESAGGWRSLVALNVTPTSTKRSTVSSTAAVDWDKLKLANDFSQSHSSSASLLVIRNGWIAGEWGKQSAVGVASVSKSIAGLTAAKLFDLSSAGTLGAGFGPQALASRYLPSSWVQTDSRKKSTTIQHLMTMTSGLVPHDKPGGSNYLSTVMKQPMQTSPGAQWAYASLPVDLLSVAIQNYAGTTVQSLFQKHIGTPIGVSSLKWTLFDKYSLASSGVSISPRDLARVGYLMLMNGSWNSGSGQRQIVSRANLDLVRRVPSWLPKAKFVTTPGSPFAVPTSSPQSYGETWWTNCGPRPLGRTVPVDAYYARGYGENLLVVVPSLNLVVVRTGPQPTNSADFHVQLMSRLMTAMVVQAAPTSCSASY